MSYARSPRLVCSTTIGTKLFMYGSNRSDMGTDLLVSVTQMVAARNSVKPASAQPRRDRKFADSLLERTGFELVVRDLSETFLYSSGAVKWPGSHSRFLR